MSTEESNFLKQTVYNQIEFKKRTDDDFTNIVYNKTPVCFI